MGSTVYIGLAVTSASSSVLDTAMLDQVSIDSTPTVATAASAAPGTVTGTTTNLSVLGGDVLGESTLTYTWAATAVPTGASSPTFAVNGTNAAKNDTVTFAQPGNYTFTVTIANPGGLSTTSSVTVSVNQTLTSIIVSPATAALSAAGTQSFSAVADDQFGQALASQPTFTWSVAGGGIGGTISAAGLYTRPSPGIGSDTIVAAAGRTERRRGGDGHVRGGHSVGGNDPAAEQRHRRQSVRPGGVGRGRLRERRPDVRRQRDASPGEQPRPPGGSAHRDGQHGCGHVLRPGARPGRPGRHPAGRGR